MCVCVNVFMYLACKMCVCVYVACVGTFDCVFVCVHVLHVCVDVLHMV